MLTAIPFPITFLLVCQMESYAACRQLYPPSAPFPKLSCLALLFLAADLLMEFVPVPPQLGVLLGGLLLNVWAALTMFRGSRITVAGVALLSWGLCVEGAYLTYLLAGAYILDSRGWYGAMLGMVWMSICSLLLDLLLLAVWLVEGKKVEWPRLLLAASCHLEFAAVGLFICHTLAHGSPQLPVGLTAALLLSVSYVAVLSMCRGILRHSAVWKRRRREIHAQLKEQEGEFAASAAALARARRMRHDFGNHAQVACSLAENGNPDEALRYLDNVRRVWQQAGPASVELQAFGRLTGELSKSCTAAGISLRIGGQAPEEAGYSRQMALSLLKDVVEWGIAYLRGTPCATVELYLHGEECFECLLTPAGSPSPAAQRDLQRACGPGSTAKYDMAGNQLRILVSGRRTGVATIQT